MANTYTPQTWTDGVSSASAARLAVIETGVQGAWARELAYAQITASQNVTATTAAGADTVVNAGTVTFDGSTTVWVEFGAAYLHTGTNRLDIHLWDNATDLGQIGYLDAGFSPAGMKRRLTPTAAGHAYNIRAFVDAGTGIVGASVGTASTTPQPAFISVYRA